MMDYIACIAAGLVAAFLLAKASYDCGQIHKWIGGILKTPLPTETEVRLALFVHIAAKVIREEEATRKAITLGGLSDETLAQLKQLMSQNEVRK